MLVIRGEFDSRVSRGFTRSSLDTCDSRDTWRIDYCSGVSHVFSRIIQLQHLESCIKICHVEVYQ